MAFERILTRNVGNLAARTLKGYEAAGGFAPLRKALKEMTPLEVTEEVKKSGIRGRGGAAFPMGIKWEAVAAAGAKPVLVSNADEAEPGTPTSRSRRGTGKTTRESWQS